jgi:hypothetical protein
MRDLLRSVLANLGRAAALAWLLIIAPLELATSLAALIARSPAAIGAFGLALVAARVLVVASGLMLGRHLAQRTPGLRPFAAGWAAADLGTLALAFTIDALPSNRVPGDAPLVWASYAAAALLVYLAAD